MVNADCHSFHLYHSLEAKKQNKQKAVGKKKKEPKLSHKGTECLVEFVKTDLLIPLSSVLLRCQHGGGILF